MLQFRSSIFSQVKKLKDRLRKTRYENSEIAQELSRIKADVQITEVDLKRIPVVQQENTVLVARLNALQEQYDKLKQENLDLKKRFCATTT